MGGDYGNQRPRETGDGFGVDAIEDIVDDCIDSYDPLGPRLQFLGPCERVREVEAMGEPLGRFHLKRVVPGAAFGSPERSQAARELREGTQRLGDGRTGGETRAGQLLLDPS